MAKDKPETQIEYDGRTGEPVRVVKTVHDRPRKGGLGALLGGALLAALLIAVGLAIYANQQGGLEEAGAAAERGLSQAEIEARQAAEQAGDQIERATD